MSIVYKLAIYYRVSTDHQDFDSQKFAIDEWLAQFRLENRDQLSQKEPKLKITEYKDHALSGKNDQRPAYQKLIQDAMNLRMNYIVVYRLDRLSRSASDAISSLLTFEQLGISFISVTQPVLNIDSKNPFRRTMLAAFAEIAEIERQTIVERVKVGLHAAKKRGVKLGQPSKITDELTQRVLKLRQDGHSLRQISEAVALSYGLVHKIIKNQQSCDS